MTQTTYLDFELEIGNGVDGRYPVTLWRSPAGEARGEMILPAQPFAVGTDFAAITRQQAQLFGTMLFTALLKGDVRERYAVSQQMTAQAGQGLRLKLRITPTALLTVPWELLYDPREDEFVCLTRQTPLVRYLTIAQTVEPLTVQPPLRILGMIASPTDLPALDVAGEKARLTAALAPLQRAGQVELTWIDGQHWRDLQQALQSGPWHVFHYVGHADFDAQADEGALWLADSNAYGQRFTAHELARLLADQPALRLVVLNACAGAQSGTVSHFSSLAGRLVRRGLPAVIAMQTAISDGAALEFSQSFYTALSTLPVDAALSEARKAISFRQPETVEWAIPVFYLRADDGRLWAAAQPTEELMAEGKQGATYNSNTGKGRVIQGNVNSGRDFVGRDRITYGNVVQGHNVGRDLMITTISDAQNVAVGKGIRQINTAASQQPTAADKTIIAAHFTQVMATLRSAGIDAGRLAKAEARLEMLQEELTKVNGNETPDDGVIIKMGDWLLDNVPEIAGAITSLLTTEAVGKVLQKAGKDAMAWVKRRIG